MKKCLTLALILMMLVACVPEPEPTYCYVDWNWGGATLEVYGVDAWKICEALRAYGFRDHGLMFYPSSGIGNESIMCEFEGEDLYYAVWDEPAWEAGAEFCAFWGGFDELP